MTEDTNAAAGDAPAEFTLIRSTGRLSKAFFLDPETGHVRQEPPGVLNRGTATRMRIANIADLLPILRGLDEHCIIVAGRIMRDDVATDADDGSVPIMSADYIRRAQANGHDVSRVITRTKDCLGYVAGEPAVMMGDHDAGDFDPGFRARLKEAGGVVAVLLRICPALADVAMVAHPSSSRGILRDDGTPVRDSDNLHLSMLAHDGAAARDFFQRLHARLVLTGWGWVFVTKAGKAEVRSLLDMAASGVGERIWASGPVALGAGLKQREGARDPVLLHEGGGRLDARTALAPLTDDERVKLKEAEAALIAAHEEEIARVRAAWRERERQRRKERGASDEEIERHFGRMERQELDGEALLHLDDGSAVEVADVLRDVRGFIRRHGNAEGVVTMRDPLEPDYHGDAGNVAVLDAGSQGRPSVFSQAHGGQRFTLGWSADDIGRAAHAASSAFALEASGLTLPQAIAEAALWMMPARLPSASLTALDVALSGCGVTLEQAVACDMLRDDAAWLRGMAEAAGIVGAPKACPWIVTRLMGAEDDVANGAERDGLAPGLRAALAAFWAAARAEDAEGAKRLQAAVAEARRLHDRMARDIRGGLDEEDEDADPDAPASDADAAGSPGAARVATKVYGPGYGAPPVKARRTVVGPLARGQATILAGPPGVTKSALSLLIACAVLWNRPDLIGEDEADRRGDVVYISNEDDLDEVERRVQAMAKAHRLAFTDMEGQLSVFGGGGPWALLRRATAKDVLAPTKKAALLIERLKNSAADGRPPALVIVDTAISTAPGIAENDANDMQVLMALMARIAREADVAVLLIHHSGKASWRAEDGGAGDMAALRGSGAMAGAARSIITATPMSKKEGGDLGIADDERFQWMRADIAKASYAKRGGVPRWFRREGVRLNAIDDRQPDTPTHTSGLALRHYPDGPKAVPVDDDAVLARIARGTEGGEPYSADKNAGSRCVFAMLAFDFGMAEARARKWIEGNLKEGRLRKTQKVISPKNRRGVRCILAVGLSGIGGCAEEEPAEAEC